MAFEGEQQQLNVEMDATTKQLESYFYIKTINYSAKEKINLEQGTNTYTFRNASKGEGLLKI